MHELLKCMHELFKCICMSWFKCMYAWAVQVYMHKLFKCMHGLFKCICMSCSSVCVSCSSVYASAVQVYVYELFKCMHELFKCMPELFKYMHKPFKCMAWSNPKGRPGMSDVNLLSGTLGLSFDSPFLSLLSFFSAKSSCSFCPVVFLLTVHSPDFFTQKILQHFSFRDRLFWMELSLNS